MTISIVDLPPQMQKQALEKLKAREKEKAERVKAQGQISILKPENKNKVHAERTEDGYASKKEARRAEALRLMEQAGEISDLREQVEFELVPTIYVDDEGVYHTCDGARNIQEARSMLRKKLKVAERSMTYICDFVYTDNKTGETVVEDVKGYTKSNAALYRIFSMKRKLLLWRYGIKVKEV